MSKTPLEPLEPQKRTEPNDVREPKPKQKALALFFGGLLPIIAFTLIEDNYGVIAGLSAGMAFGVGEICYEYFKFKKVQLATWIGNGLLIGLGAISLLSDDGIWFKLQPALFELGFALALIISSWLKRPLLIVLLEKQNPEFPEVLKSKFKGINFRLGIFFFIQSILATYAAFYWSTTAWALLKGIGLTLSMLFYFIVEILLIRRSLKK